MGERFTFLAEAVYDKEEKGQVAVLGFLMGKVQEGDEVYLYHPGIPVQARKIMQIETAPGQFAKEAENQNVSLHFADCSREEIPIFTVFSNRKSAAMMDQEEAVENPELLGLLTGYQKFHEDRRYINLLTYRIVHARYLMAHYTGAQAQKNEKGITMYQEGTEIVFPVVVNKDDVSATPVFTDLEAMKKWENIFQRDCQAKIGVQTFSMVCSVSFDGNSGMVINPFGPVTMFLPNDFLKDLLNSRSYQMEFEVEQDLSDEPEGEQKVKIEVPQETEQVMQMKEAYAAYGRTNPDVKAIYFFWKKARKGECFLCVIDIPKEKENEVFRSVHEKVAGFLKENQYIEYTIKATSFGEIDEHFSPIYRADDQTK